MGWFLLFLAIILEVVGATCMKLSNGFTKWVPSLLVLVFYGLAFGAFVLVLKKGISLSAAYAIWCGAAIALIAVVGIFYFKEPVTTLKMVSIVFITIGVVGLSLAKVTG